MCGLAAMIGPGVTRDDLKAINDLAYVTGLRGFHSTGVYQVRKNYKNELEDPTLEKRAMPVGDFQTLHSLDKKDYPDLGINPKILNDTLANLFMIHCRYATFGAVNDQNAHPFETERYVGMHNGSLVDFRYTSKHGEHANKTDSERMFMDMDKYGVEQTLANLEKGSAYAVFVFDKQEKKLYVARNNLRTLYFTTNKKRGVSYFSSEIEMLRLALNRRNIEYGDIYYFEPGRIYTFDLVSQGFSFDKDNGWRADFKVADLPASNRQVTPSPKWEQEDYYQRRFDSSFRSRSDLHTEYDKKGKKRTSKEDEQGKESTKSSESTVVDFPRRRGTRDLIGIKRDREDKFYCDECSAYVFGHEKETSAKIFADSETLLCADCMDVHINPNINPSVIH